MGEGRGGGGLANTKVEFVYVFYSYTAAAIVIHDREKYEIPYLDKFVVSSKCQVRSTIFTAKTAI